MHLCVSYAREDRQKVEALSARLSDLGHETWMDRQLTGGQAWWDEVLRHILWADAVVLALSPASQRSQACAAERWYAAAAQRPLLPLMVEPLALDTLPAEVARLHVVNYVTPSEEAAIHLARAVMHLPPAPPVPDPAPDPPPVPHSYLMGLSGQLSSPTLPMETQLALVSQLESALKSPDADERQSAGALLLTLIQRRDLYAETYHRCQRLIPAAEAADNTPGPYPIRSPAATQQGPSRQPETSGTPVWVKVLAWIGAGVVLLFVLALCAAEQTCTDYLGNSVPC